MADNKIISLFGIEEALTPLDGRNRYKLINLTQYFSELALNKYRVLVELTYFKKLSEYKVIRKLTKSENTLINKIYVSFDKKAYGEIRLIEKSTNHDVKAVEEFIKNKFKKTSLNDLSEMIHFGLTSDDINNCAYALMIKDTLKNIITPEINKILDGLKQNANKHKSIPMLSRTHGQPAAPTTVGKEFLVYYMRLKKELKILESSKIEAKLSGNTGNLNVHKFLFPNINWLEFSKGFIQSLDLQPDMVTTQIEPYDSLIRIFSSLSRMNNVLLGLCVDFWIYVSFGYFKQKVIKAEVGSTALPHKVNPIYFEGAEGGFGIANALLEFYSKKLSYSRLQRDLSDSTIRRSFGIAFAYSLLSYQSINEALKRIEPNKEAIKKDLLEHWEIVSEGLQNFLRTKGLKNAYEKTKQFFRGKIINQKDVAQFIYGLKLNEDDKKMLLQLTPEKYTGYAEEIVKRLSL